MIAYIALTLSVINSILWIVLAVGIRRVFKKMYPLFQSFGVSQSQNLTYPPIYDKMREPSQLTDAESEQ